MERSRARNQGGRRGRSGGRISSNSNSYASGSTIDDGGGGLPKICEMTREKDCGRRGVVPAPTSGGDGKERMGSNLRRKTNKETFGFGEVDDHDRGR